MRYFIKMALTDDEIMQREVAEHFRKEHEKQLLRRKKIYEETKNMNAAEKRNYFYYLRQNMGRMKGIDYV